MSPSSTYKPNGKYQRRSNKPQLDQRLNLFITDELAVFILQQTAANSSVSATVRQWIEEKRAEIEAKKGVEACQKIDL